MKLLSHYHFTSKQNSKSNPFTLLFHSSSIFIHTNVCNTNASASASTLLMASSLSSSSSRGRSNSPFHYHKPSTPYSSSSSSSSSSSIMNNGRMLPRSYSSSMTSFYGSGNSYNSRSMTPSHSRSDSVYSQGYENRTPVSYPSEEEMIDEPPEMSRSGDSISVTVRFRPMRSVLDLLQLILDICTAEL